MLHVYLKELTLVLLLLMCHGVPPCYGQTSIHLDPTLLQGHCPGEVVTLTCTTTGSPILAWRSEEYIGPGTTQLEFARVNGVGERQSSHLYPNAVYATLTDKSADTNLTSTLSITLPAEIQTSSVTCVNVGNGANMSATINLLDEAEALRQLKSVLRREANNMCAVDLSWELPSNFAQEDVSHFMVAINNEENNVMNEISYNYTMCFCEPHNVTITLVDRCGREGSTTSTISANTSRPFFDECDLPTTTTTTYNEGGKCDSSYRLILGLLIIFIIVSLVLGIILVSIVLYICSKKKPNCKVAGGKSRSISSGENEQKYSSVPTEDSGQIMLSSLPSKDGVQNTHLSVPSGESGLNTKLSVPSGERGHLTINVPTGDNGQGTSPKPSPGESGRIHDTRLLRPSSARSRSSSASSGERGQLLSVPSGEKGFLVKAPIGNSGQGISPKPSPGESGRRQGSGLLRSSSARSRSSSSSSGYQQLENTSQSLPTGDSGQGTSPKPSPGESGQRQGSRLLRSSSARSRSSSSSSGYQQLENTSHCPPTEDYTESTISNVKVTIEDTVL